MTRFAIDVDTLLAIVDGDIEVNADHQLVGTGDLRSQALTRIYTSFRRGELDKKAAHEKLTRVTELKMRLLNDRGSRDMAWRIAVQLDLDDPRPVELLAVAKLQADAIVTDDPELKRLAKGIVPVAPVARLRSAPPA